MNPKGTRAGDHAELRRKAEAIARKKKVPSSVGPEALSPAETSHTIHELQVHQIELELQNEELKRTQVELAEARGRYFDLYDLAPIGYVTLSEKGLVLETNLTVANLLGMDRASLLQQPLSRFILPPDQDLYYLLSQQLFSIGSPQECELRLVPRKGPPLWAHLAATVTRFANDSPISRVVISDITPRKQAEELLQRAQEALEERVRARTAEVWQANEKLAMEITERRRTEERLKASLSDKEVMLKEIHHRVKNNLQVICSLVDLQGGTLDNPALRGPFHIIRDRLRSMAMIHEKLYQSESLAHLNFAEYARSLLAYLWRAHGGVESCIRLKLDMQPVFLTPESAVPCGLILNELITNALKYAFRDRAEGEVTVALNMGPDGQITLRVRDNGVGLPTGLDWRHAPSLGLQLVQLLTRQLKGSVAMNQNAGTEFVLIFRGKDPEQFTRP